MLAAGTSWFSRPLNVWTNWFRSLPTKNATTYWIRYCKYFPMIPREVMTANGLFKIFYLYILLCLLFRMTQYDRVEEVLIDVLLWSVMVFLKHFNSFAFINCIQLFCESLLSCIGSPWLSRFWVISDWWVRKNSTHRCINYKKITLVLKRWHFSCGLLLLMFVLVTR